MKTSPKELLINILKAHSLKQENEDYTLPYSEWEHVTNIIIETFTLRTEAMSKRLSFIQQMDETIKEINELTDQIWRIQNHADNKNKSST